MEMVSKEEAEPLVLNMCQFLNPDRDLESLFINTARVYVRTHTHTRLYIYYTCLCVMLINSASHISLLIDSIDDCFIHLVADPFK